MGDLYITVKFDSKDVDETALVLKSIYEGLVDEGTCRNIVDAVIAVSKTGLYDITEQLCSVCKLDISRDEYDALCDHFNRSVGLKFSKN